MNKDEQRKAMSEAVKAEFEQAAAMPHPRDILKEEYNRSLTRPRDMALEKWGPEIEAMLHDDSFMKRISATGRARRMIEASQSKEIDTPDKE